MKHFEESEGRGSLAAESKSALLAGGAGGIGLGIGSSLGRRGWRLALADSDENRLNQATTELSGEATTVAAFQTDLTSGSEVQAMVQRAESSIGPVDLLINAAGILRTNRFLDISEDEWDAVLAANLKSTFLTCRAVLPGMVQRGGGVIVNVSSIAARHYTTAHVHYAAAKAAVEALTRDLAYEVAPHGVRVVCIAPGPIATPMNQSGLPEELEKALTASLRIGRFGTPQDIGEAVAYLASDAASFVTGTTLTVAGGSDLSVFDPHRVAE